MIPEEKESRDLWSNIKELRKKFRKPEVVPEEFRLPEFTTPLERKEADAHQGLSKAEVDDRVARDAVNHAVGSASKSQKEIICSNIFTYFNLLFFIIAVMLIAVGSFRDLTFLPVIIANTAIGIFQELRSKKVLDDLTILNAPKNTVVRDGQEQVIAAEELVLDDIIILSAGNQIPADAIVLEGEVLVNEALLTGESDQITKKKGDELLSGSFIVSGECRARIDKVGSDSYIAKLTLEAKEMKDGEVSEMIRALDRLVKIVGIIIIPIGIILFSQQHFINETPIRESVTATVAAIIGMIPEGLYLLASVALAVSVMRLASKKVLVHNMKCIETLARVDVLCVDKTGTITDNTMTVKKVLPLRKTVVESDDGLQKAQEGVADTTAANSSVADQKQMAGNVPTKQETQDKRSGVEGSGTEEIPAFTPEESAAFELAVGDFAAAMATDNITMKAIKEHFRKRSGKRPEKVIPFSSATKYSGAVFEDGSYVLGAPEFILRESYEEYSSQIERWSRQGFRVLVFAEYPGTLTGEALT
ncbi:MAG: HAD-IC family P-type ATPase, partial [Lachnospiraceae bacterium]